MIYQKPIIRNIYDYNLYFGYIPLKEGIKLITFSNLTMITPTECRVIQNKLYFHNKFFCKTQMNSFCICVSMHNMGVTSWERNIERKGDIVIAKNYLKEEEIEDLNRLVDIFLTSAEMRDKGREDLTMQYWRDNVAVLLQFQGKPILKDKGRATKTKQKH